MTKTQRDVTGLVRAQTRATSWSPAVKAQRACTMQKLRRWKVTPPVTIEATHRFHSSERAAIEIVRSA
jgi:hypothetical protein